MRNRFLEDRWTWDWRYWWSCGDWERVSCHCWAWLARCRWCRNIAQMSQGWIMEDLLSDEDEKWKIFERVLIFLSINSIVSEEKIGWSRYGDNTWEDKIIIAHSAYRVYSEGGMSDDKKRAQKKNLDIHLIVIYLSYLSLHLIFFFCCFLFPSLFP